MAYLLQKQGRVERRFAPCTRLQMDGHDVDYAEEDWETTRVLPEEEDENDIALSGKGYREAEMHEMICSYRKLKSVFCSFKNDADNYNTGQILFLAVSHKGDRMVTGSSDGLLKVFDCFSMKLLISIDPNVKAITLMILSKDDRFLVISDRDSIIHIYDFQTYKKLSQINNLRNSEIFTMDFSQPEGKLFLTVCTTKHGIWVYKSDLFDGSNNASFEEGSRLLLPFTQWTCCEVSSTTGTINAIDVDGNLHSWPALAQLFEEGESLESVSKILFDNRYKPEILLFNDYSQIILLYNKGTHFFIRVEGNAFTIVKEERYTKLNPKSYERAVVVNQNKRYCFIVVNDERRKEELNDEIGTVNSKIYMYEYISNSQVRSIAKKIDENNSVLEMNTNIFLIESHPNFPKIFLTGDYEGQIVLWDISKGTILKIFKETFKGQTMSNIPNPIMEAQFFQTGLQFVVSTYYGIISLYGYGACHDVLIQPDEQFFEQDLMNAPQMRNLTSEQDLEQGEHNEPDSKKEELKRQIEEELEKIEQTKTEKIRAQTVNVGLNDILQVEDSPSQNKELEVKENSESENHQNDSKKEDFDGDKSESDKENEISEKKEFDEELEIKKEDEEKENSGEESEEESLDQNEISNMIGLNNLTMGQADRGVQVDLANQHRLTEDSGLQLPVEKTKISHDRGNLCDSNLTRADQWNQHSEKVYFDYYQGKLKEIKRKEERMKEEADDVQNTYMDVYFKEKERLKTGIIIDSEMPISHHLIERMGLGFRKKKKNQILQDFPVDEEVGREIITRRREIYDGDSEESSGDEINRSQFRISERRRRQMERRQEEERRRRQEQEQEEQRLRAQRRRRERQRQQARESQAATNQVWVNGGVMTRSMIRAREALGRDQNENMQSETSENNSQLNENHEEEIDSEDELENKNDEEILDEEIEELEELEEDENLNGLDDLEEEEENTLFLNRRVSTRLMKRKARFELAQQNEEFSSIAANAGKRRRRNMKRDLKLIEETDENLSPQSKKSNRNFEHNTSMNLNSSNHSHSHGISSLTRFGNRRRDRKTSLLGIDGKKSVSQNSDTLNGKESVASYQLTESHSKPKNCSFCLLEIKDPKRKRKCSDCGRIFHIRECLAKATHKVNHTVYCLHCYIEWKKKDSYVKECIKMSKFKFQDLNRSYFKMTQSLIEDPNNPGVLIHPILEQGRYRLIPDMFRHFTTYFANILPPETFTQNLDLLMIAKADLEIFVYETDSTLPKMRFKYESLKFSEKNELFVFQTIKAKIMNCNVNQLRTSFGLDPIVTRDPCLVDFAYTTSPNLNQRFLIPEAQYKFLLNQFPKLGAENAFEEVCGNSFSIERIRNTPETFYNLLELTPYDSEKKMTRTNRKQMIERGHPQYIKRLSQEFLQVEKNLTPFQLKSQDFPEKIKNSMEECSQIFHFFEKPVNKSLYKDYLQSVAVEMSVQVILERLKNHFYLCKSSIEKDFRLIQKNARDYNTQNSPVYRFARFMAEIMIFSIDADYSPEEKEKIDERKKSLIKTGFDPNFKDETNEAISEPEKEEKKPSPGKPKNPMKVSIIVNQKNPKEEEAEELASTSQYFKPRSTRLKKTFSKILEREPELIGKREHLQFEKLSKQKNGKPRRRLMKINEIQDFQTRDKRKSKLEQIEIETLIEKEDDLISLEEVQKEIFMKEQKNNTSIRTRRRRAFESKKQEHN